MPDQEIRNQIITEFKASGDQKVTAALDRVKSKHKDIIDRAVEANDVFKIWEDRVSNFDRNQTLRKISTDLAKAASKGKDLENALALAQKRLQEIGATSAESRQAIEGAFDSASSRGASLARGLGRAARVNLPAIPLGQFSTEQIARGIEGLGAVQDAVGRLGVVGKAAALGVGAAVVAVAALLIDLKRKNDELKASADAALGGAKQYFELVSGGTKDSIEAGLKEARIREDAAAKNLAFQQSVLDGLEQAVDAGGAFSRITTEAGVAVAGITGSQPELRATREAVEAAKKEYAEASGAVKAHEQALNSAEVATRSATEAEEELRLAREKVLGSDETRSQISTLADISSLTEKSVNDRIEAIKREQATINDYIGKGFITDPELLSELRDQRLPQLAIQLRFLTSTILPLVKAQDAEIKAKERAKQIYEDSVKAVRAFDESIADMTTQRAEKEADIYRKLNDNIVKAAEDALQQSEDALRKLQERRADLGTDLGRDFRDEQRKAQQDQLDEQIKYQQDEAKSYREHLRDLRGIREDAQAREFDLVLNRDFAGLRQLRVDTNRRLREETRQFSEQQAERELAFKQQQADDARQRTFEHESRLLRYQDALEDAQKQADRELQQIERNKQRQLARLNSAALAEFTLLDQKQRQEYAMKQAALTAELQATASATKAITDQWLFLRSLFYRTGGPSVGNFLGGVSNVSSTSNTLNAPINISSGGNAAQQNALADFVRGLIAQAFSQYAGAN